MKLPDWRDSLYMITCEDDGVYLCNQLGFKAPREDMEEVAKLLLKTARIHEKDITIHNLEVERYYEVEIHQCRPKDDKPRIKPRYLYMFKCGDGRYKIGVSVDVERRRKQLDNRPYPVTIVAASAKPFRRAFEIEDYLHGLLDEDNLSGEWFAIDDERAELIAELVSVADDDFETGD